MDESVFQLEMVSVRLVKETPLLSDKPLSSPEDAVEFIGEKLSQMDREVVCVIHLNSANMPINCHIASMGALSYAVVEPRELFKASFLSNAFSMILVHNHRRRGMLTS